MQFRIHNALSPGTKVAWSYKVLKVKEVALGNFRLSPFQNECNNSKLPTFYLFRSDENNRLSKKHKTKHIGRSQLC